MLFYTDVVLYFVIVLFIVLYLSNDKINMIVFVFKFQQSVIRVNIYRVWFTVSVCVILTSCC